MKKLTRNGGQDYLFYRYCPNNTVEIYDIAVKSARRHGIGTRMITQLKEITDGNIFAFMRESNEVAKKFYEANGFVAHHITNFYPDEGAYLMLWSAQ